jgi:anti-sigma-K factor RskA
MSDHSGHPNIEELIAAYSLDAVQEQDRRGVERDLLEHLPGCSSCQALLRDLRDVAGDLALAAGTSPLPPEFEKRLMDAARGEKRATGRARTRWVSRAALMVALLSIAALATWNVRLAGSLHDVRAQKGSIVAASRLLNDPSARRAPLTSAASPQAVITVALRADGRAALLGTRLPSVPAGKVLELWLMRGDEPVAAAVFRARAGVAALTFSVPSGEFDGAAITIEKGPHGAPKPTGPMIFTGPFTT